jgi:Protein of unknown function (DUF3089)
MRNIVIFFLLVFAIVFTEACKSRAYTVKAAYNTIPTPAPPNYADTANWFALPGRNDMADRIMGQKNLAYTKEDSLKADVFFVYPTIFTGKATDEYLWNANVDNELLNKRITNTTIKYQATAFNGAGRMYIPKYRQAQLTAYYTKSPGDAKAAFDTAYADVKRAFEYYMEHYNNGRPIIIASHSQGTNHAERLIGDYFDGKALQKQLVAAYLVGMPINKTRYTTIKPCSSPTETGCFCTWTTFKRNYRPKTFYCRGYADAAVTNPISWTVNDTIVSRKENIGGLFYNDKKIAKHTSNAQTTKGLLWIRHPHFPGSFLVYMKNYHVGDINLFYYNVRQNAIQRVDSFIKR